MLSRLFVVASSPGSPPPRVLLKIKREGESLVANGHVRVLPVRGYQLAVCNLAAEDRDRSSVSVRYVYMCSCIQVPKFR